MAKKAAARIELRDWDEVDIALRRIAECQIALDTIDAEMNMKINDAKAEADKLATPLRLAVKEQTGLVQDFTDGHRADLDGKSKQLTFGTVGYRTSPPKAHIPAGKTESVIENLREFGMDNCLNIKVSINRNILATYKEEDVLKVGAKMVREDNFFCEPDKEKVRR